MGLEPTTHLFRQSALVPGQLRRQGLKEYVTNYTCKVKPTHSGTGTNSTYTEEQARVMKHPKDTQTQCKFNCTRSLSQGKANNSTIPAYRYVRYVRVCVCVCMYVSVCACVRAYAWTLAPGSFHRQTHLDTHFMSVLPAVDHGLIALCIFAV